jgi:hypothetical protein
MTRRSIKLAPGLLAVAVVPAAVAAVVVHRSSDGASPTTARNARLLPTQANPLRLKGTGFVPRERVRLKVVRDMGSSARSVTASTTGSFVVIFSRLSACDATTVTATGSRGSRASFTFSQIVCLEP